MKIKCKVCLDTVYKIIKLLLKYNKIYPIVLFIIAIIKSILPFLSLINTQNIINSIQKANGLNNILMFMIIFVILNTCSLFFNSLYGYFFGKYKELLYLKVNQDILNKTNDLEYVDFENNEIYNLLQRAEMEAGVRPISIFSSLIAIITSSITIISSLLILVSWKSWTLIGFILLPLFAFKYYKSIGNLEYNMIFNRTEYERKSWYISHLLTKDNSIKEIKMLNLFPFLINKFNNLRKMFYKENIKILKRKSIFLFIYQFCNIAFMCFVVLVAMIETIGGKLMLGTLMTYINTTSKVDNSINLFSNTLFSLYQDSLYAINIITFLELPRNTKEKNKEGIESKAKLNKIETIEFKNVSFKYPKQNIYALKNINFSIKRGDTVAIVGENGSGKSTLIKILSGLYKEYEGTILINGIELKRFSESNLRKRLSVVFQDFNNYQFTVKDNIGFGNIKQLNNFEKIKEAARDADASQFIANLPNGINQQVGNWFDNGVQLSGGQWQKLALSRAFMKEAEIFILDEPTAALDPLSEYSFFNSFIKKSRTKVSIIITHRFSNVKIASKIIVLKKGKIICQGCHDDLIKNNVLYNKMYNLSNIIERRKDNEKNIIFYS